MEEENNCSIVPKNVMELIAVEAACKHATGLKNDLYILQIGMMANFKIRDKEVSDSRG